MSGVLADPKLQASSTGCRPRASARRPRPAPGSPSAPRRASCPWDGLDEKSHRYMADKLVALEPSKAEFCHLMCRALRARRVVEVGTSFGVSTLYLADAVRANGGGVVIGTEHEPAKAAAARANFAEAGLVGPHRPARGRPARDA